MASYDIPFIAGVDEGKDPKVMESPRLVQAENMRVDQDGLVRKRRGTGEIALNAVDSGQGSPTPVGPVGLAVHRDQLIVGGENRFWTYSESADRLEELDYGTALTLERVHSLGHYGGKNVIATGVASIAAFTVWAWSVQKDPDPLDSGAVATYEIHVLTVDNTTGAAAPATKIKLFDDESINVRTLRVIAIGGSKITVFWGESNGIYRLDVTSATSGPYSYLATTGTLHASTVTGMDEEQWMDVVPHGDGYLMAWNYSTVPGNVYIGLFNSSHVLQDSVQMTPTGDDPRIQLCGDMTGPDDIVCAIFVTTTTNAQIVWYDSNLDAVEASGIVYSSASNWDDNGVNGLVAATYDPDEASVVVGISGTSSVCDFARFYVFSYATDDINSLSDGSSHEIANTYVAAKPFVRSGRVFAFCEYRTSQPNSHYAVLGFGADSVIDSDGIWSSFQRPEVTVLRGQGPEIDGYGIGASIGVRGDRIYLPARMLDRYSNPNALEDPTGRQEVIPGGSSAVGTQVISVVGANGYELAYRPRDRYMVAHLEGYTFFGGGTVLALCERRLAEISFSSYPDITLADLTVTATGGNLVDGLYTYGFVWEWVDTRGNLAQSAPKIVQVVVDEGTGTASVRIAMPPPMLSQFRYRGSGRSIWGDDGRPMTLAIYASEVTLLDDNGDPLDSDEQTAESGGLTLHRLEGSGVQAFPENPGGTSILAEPLLPGFGYVDTYDRDTINLISRELLYATEFGADELPNMAPPPSKLVVAHDGRLWMRNDERKSQLCYTKYMFAGRAPAWNSSLVVQFDGDVEAFTAQDGDLVVFTRHKVYTVRGQGYDNSSNLERNYDPPELLSSDRGCINHRAVVSVPNTGVFFESQRGLEVLPRGALEAIPQDAIQETLATYPVITGTCDVAYASTVLFSCVTSEDLTTNPTGRVLAYDYSNGVWFVLNYQNKPISAMATRGSRVVFGVYDAASDLTLWQEDAGFDDPGSAFVGWTIELADLRIGGLTGYHQIDFIGLMGRALGAETIHVDESRDSGATWSTVVSWDVTAASREFYRRYQTLVRKAPSHRFRFRGTQYSTNFDSEGIALHGIKVSGSRISGHTRLPAAMRG